MKVQKDVIYYTCTFEELDEFGNPPAIDEDGNAPQQNAICELLNDDNTITLYFQYVGEQWFQYGEREGD